MPSIVVSRHIVLARLVAALAGAWACVFAVLHVYWAGGGRAFIGSTPQADAAFARPTFAIYNGVVAVLCVAGVAVAIVLLDVLRPPRRILTLAVFAAWLAGALLLARGGVGVVQGLLGLAPPVGQQAAYDFDPWFLLGGVLFGLAAAVRPTARHPSPGPLGAHTANGETAPPPSVEPGHGAVR